MKNMLLYKHTINTVIQLMIHSIFIQKNFIVFLKFLSVISFL